MTLTIANKSTIALVTGQAAYPSGAYIDRQAAEMNRALVRATGDKLPCYALPAKRGRFKYVSIGSSAVISKGVAKEWFARFGVDLEELEYFVFVAY